MMQVLIRAAAGEYQVLVGRGLIARCGESLRAAGLDGAVRLIADEQVYQRYGQPVEMGLRACGYSVTSFTVPSGESSKSLETAAQLYDWLVDVGTERRDLVLALGGGVAGDLAGFVAATFLRGLRLVQFPTSLLAQVDSSVGGKVAVNHPRGKNLIGAFHAPSLVVADSEALLTLPPREISNAMAEIVKTGIILDAPLFERLESEAESLLRLVEPGIEQIVARCVELKARVVEEDERERGMRAILNYGHTIGHAIEAVTGFESYRHGEAVSVGHGWRRNGGVAAGDDRRGRGPPTGASAPSLRVTGLLPRTVARPVDRGHGSRQEAQPGPVELGAPQRRRLCYYQARRAVECGQRGPGLASDAMMASDRTG